MGIGSITSMNSMSGMQMTMAGSTNSKSKNIQNEITDAQRQMQTLSSKEDLSVSEKTTEREKLQKKISSLNTELKQHQEELSKSQRREIMMAELQGDKEPAKEEKAETKAQAEKTSIDKADENKGTVIARTQDGVVILKGKDDQDEKRGIDPETKTAEEISADKADEKNPPIDRQQADEAKEEANAEKEPKTSESDKDADAGLPQKETHAIVSADTSLRQAGRQGAVIARIKDGIAILKGEINQDEKRGIDTERKQAELEKMEKREQRAREFQSSVLGEANKTMKSAANTKMPGTKDDTQVNAENNAIINAFKLSNAEDQASQQRFYVSFG